MGGKEFSSFSWRLLWLFAYMISVISVVQLLQPDDDEDEDLDDFGPIPTEEDLQQISKKIHNLDIMDPVSFSSLLNPCSRGFSSSGPFPSFFLLQDSKMVRYLRERFNRLQHDIQRKKVNL